MIIQTFSPPLSPSDGGGAGGWGLRARLAPWRIDPASPLCRVKHLSALDKVLAKQLAQQAHADDAIFQNIHNHLAETTASNLFIVVGGQILTPALHCGPLPGITRELLIEIAPALGYRIIETEIPLVMLATATEAFLTNAIAGVRPLVAVDGRIIGDGEPGPITTTIAEHYQQICEQAARDYRK